MLTDNETKKALECCAGKDGERFCWDCPCKNAETVKEYCDYKMLKSALDLINRLQEENESWQAAYMTEKQEIANLEIELKAMRGAANSYKAENERLKQNNKAIMQTIADVHTEAYKELAERIHCHCQSIINQEWNKKVAPVSWADAYEQFDDEVDNLYKELIGE